MNLGVILKRVREAKGLSQKEVAGLVDMPQPQYSRIEGGKTDPSFTTIERIATALDISLSELFNDFDPNEDINLPLLDKIKAIGTLPNDEKDAIFKMIDLAISNKKLKDNISGLLSNT